LNRTPTTNPYNPSPTPDILDIVITKNLSFPVYLNSCSALSSDHLPVLTVTACRSSFQHPLDRPDFRCTHWANFQTYLEDLIPFNLILHNEMATDTCVQNFSSAVLKALAAPIPKSRPCDDPGLPIPADILDATPEAPGCGTRDPALIAVLQRSVTRPFNKWRNDQWGATLRSLDPED